MPTYSYRCTQCGTEFDIHQKFTDATLTECPTCGGTLRKLFNTVGVTFNGSGFYRTDSRQAPKDGGSGGSEGGPGGSKSDGGSGGSKSDGGSGGSKSEPAKSAPAASSSSSSASTGGTSGS